MKDRLRLGPNGPTQGGEGHFVEAPALAAGEAPESPVEARRHIAKGILHATNVVSAGIWCNHDLPIPGLLATELNSRNLTGVCGVCDKNRAVSYC